MTDEEFIAEVVAACRRIPNAVAVGLGGSRSRGDHRADGDWDFAVYYRGPIDVRPLEQLQCACPPCPSQDLGSERKRMIQWAELTPSTTFAAIGRHPADLPRAIAAVGAVRDEITAQTDS